jgi:hypothetical protein
MRRTKRESGRHDEKRRGKTEVSDGKCTYNRTQSKTGDVDGEELAEFVAQRPWIMQDQNPADCRDCHPNPKPHHNPRRQERDQ